MIHIYNPEGGSEADGVRYAQVLVEMHEEPVTWEKFTASFYKEGSTNRVDIYMPVVTFFLSLVTSDPHWLFFIFAIVFGYFYSRNIWFVLEKMPDKLGFSFISFIACYMLLCPIWNINAVRMWTALHVFVYGALPYIYNSDRSKLVWCLVSIFIHFSFILPFIIFILYHFIPKSVTVFYCIYLFTFFIEAINFDSVRSFLMLVLPDFLLSRVDIYINEDLAQSDNEAMSAVNFYIRLSYQIIKWTIAVAFFVICFYGKKWLQSNKSLYNLVCISLFTYALFNIVSLLPQGVRFLEISKMFSFISIILFFAFIPNKYNNNKIRMTFKGMSLVLLVPILFFLRKGCDYYGVSLFFNPIVNLFVDDNQPIIQFVKSVF
ncbi:MAG: hypothetical protein EZS26_001263 [Candidatus Ordinivivax streblomastigis]|uniref:EpsG family protein n=1 Tax=Candidatus Ordinivivax streblomastigis TaxID=2540710 RepID=A0A5M8P1X5_9BACT|nr:MAG: hypothetical protein EZS26_001263 [Candidatus Ordinivivax streblomastigis]